MFPVYDKKIFTLRSKVTRPRSNFLQWSVALEYTTHALFKTLDKRVVHSRMHKSVSYCPSFLKSVFWFASIQVNM